MSAFNFCAMFGPISEKEFADSVHISIASNIYPVFTMFILRFALFDIFCNAPYIFSIPVNANFAVILTSDHADCTVYKD